MTLAHVLSVFLAATPIALQAQGGVVTGQLVDQNGQPVSGVRVGVMTMTGDPAVLVSQGMTDSAGHYRLEDVQPGRYHVVAGPLERPSYYGASSSKSAEVVPVSAGKTVTGIDFSIRVTYGFTVTCPWGGSPAIEPDLIFLSAPPPSLAPTGGAERISESAMRSNLIAMASPFCAQALTRDGARVDVTLEAAINKDGNVTRVSALRGHVLMNGAAEQAVKQWRFKPHMLNGKPVDVVAPITLSFVFTR